MKYLNVEKFLQEILTIFSMFVVGLLLSAFLALLTPDLLVLETALEDITTQFRTLHSLIQWTLLLGILGITIIYVLSLIRDFPFSTYLEKLFFVIFGLYIGTYLITNKYNSLIENLSTYIIIYVIYLIFSRYISYLFIIVKYIKSTQTLQSPSIKEDLLPKEDYKMNFLPSNLEVNNNLTPNLNLEESELDIPKQQEKTKEPPQDKFIPKFWENSILILEGLCLESSTKNLVVEIDKGKGRTYFLSLLQKHLHEKSFRTFLTKANSNSNMEHILKEVYQFMCELKPEEPKFFSKHKKLSHKIRLKSKSIKQNLIVLIDDFDLLPPTEIMQFLNFSESLSNSDNLKFVIPLSQKILNTPTNTTLMLSKLQYKINIPPPKKSSYLEILENYLNTNNIFMVDLSKEDILNFYILHNYYKKISQIPARSNISNDILLEISEIDIIQISEVANLYETSYVITHSLSYFSRYKKSKFTYKNLLNFIKSSKNESRKVAIEDIHQIIFNISDLKVTHFLHFLEHLLHFSKNKNISSKNLYQILQLSA